MDLDVSSLTCCSVARRYLEVGNMRTCTVGVTLLGSFTIQTLGFLVPAPRAVVPSSSRRVGPLSVSSIFGLEEETMADRVKSGLAIRFLPEVSQEPQ